MSFARVLLKGLLLRGCSKNNLVQVRQTKLKCVEAFFAHGIAFAFGTINFNRALPRFSNLKQRAGVVNARNSCLVKFCSTEDETGFIKPSDNVLQISKAIDKDYLCIDEVLKILKDDSCEELCVIKVDTARTKFHYVDYFVVTSGRSIRHLKSMAFSLCAKFKEKVREKRGKSTAIIEGEDCNDWMVVDIGNIVVHFMMPETREIYELEKLWTMGASFDDQLLKMTKTNEEFEAKVLPFKSKFASGKGLSKGLQ